MIEKPTTTCECCLKPVTPRELTPCSKCDALVCEACLEHRVCHDCLSEDEEL